MSESATLTRRWKFSLGALLLLIAVVSVVLSRFYPRFHASVQLQVVSLGPLAAHVEFARSPFILAQVVEQNPNVTELTTGDPVSWLAANLDVKPIDKTTLEIRLSGAPKDQQRLQETVDSVAEHYIDFLRSTHRPTTEIIAKLQGAYDELQASAQHKTALLNKIAQRVKEAESDLKKQPPPVLPRVMKRSSGQGW